jgi:maltose O-acetyltransferase
MKNFIVKILYHFYRILEKGYWSHTYAQYKRSYQIDPEFLFNGKNIKLLGDGEIILGAHSYIGDNSTFSVNKGYKISIGKHCKMSHNIKMYSNSFIADQDFSVLPLKEKSADIMIGNNVWMGANVFISPGVTIGDNAVIGANSLVNKDVEAFAIVGGVPAVFLRHKNIGEK